MLVSEVDIVNIFICALVLCIMIKETKGRTCQDGRALRLASIYLNEA